ncbi:MAG TPA: diaminopimelate epimerase [Polyangia bacterium]
MLGKHEFVRGHGLGNDYLVVDGERFGVELTPARVVAICDRHTGVGSDGILERVPAPAGFDAAVRIYNPDGSEAEKSGNGTRIFAKFCMDHGYAPAGGTLRMHTIGGPVSATLVERQTDRSVMRMSMGGVTFEWTEQPLTVGDRTFSTTSLSVGNPHCVIFDAPFDEASAKKYGPLVENHPKFPRRTNVQLIQPIDRSIVRALIWERGAGWTLASGTSSCAVAAACVRAGLTDREVKVVMPGGTLEVLVGEDWQLEQIGFAQEIAVGKLSADLLHAIGA